MKSILAVVLLCVVLVFVICMRQPHPLCDSAFLNQQSYIRHCREENGVPKLINNTAFICIRQNKAEIIQNDCWELEVDLKEMLKNERI